MKIKELLAVDTKTAQQEKSRHSFTLRSLKTIYKGVRIPWGKFIIASIGCMVLGVIFGIRALFTARIAAGDFSQVSDIVLYAAISLTTWLVSLVGMLLDTSGHIVVGGVRKKVWRKVLTLPMTHFDSESPNKTLSRITNDVETASIPFSFTIWIITVLAGLLGTLTASTAGMNRNMLLLIMGGFVVTVVCCAISSRMLVKSGYYENSRLSIFTSYLSERLSNFKLMKASLAEKKELHKAMQLIDLRYKAGLYHALSYTANYLALNVSNFITYFVCFIVGAFFIKDGAVENGSGLYTIYIYATSITGVLLMLGNIILQMIQAAGKSSEYAAMIDYADEDIEAGEDMPQENRDIILDHISFSYDANKKSLKNLNAVIPAGKVTAIIGPNGSGKTTAIKLIDRLYPDCDGTLYLKDQPADRYSLRSWRDQFGVVSQNAGLFSGSIRANLCYGAEGDVPAELLDQIIDLSGVRDIVDKHEEGLEYDVGINGSHLSGGEQQRLAIARAMLKNPHYLILDEATANLDTETAQKIQKGIDVLSKGRTVIVIAHDYDTVKNADHIIVINDGCTEAEGTAEELSEKSEFFREFSGLTA